MERDKSIRKLADIKMSATRRALAERDVTVTRDIENMVLDFFANSSALKHLIRTAVTHGFEVTGREFHAVVRDVMYRDAVKDVESESAPQNKSTGYFVRLSMDESGNISAEPKK